ncbi:MAG: hypothetical protein P8M70_11085 [Verrucomicrobiota bacterium]|nr:hypothetical protein [Verrucomicrobiota bacterium]
MAGCSQGSGDLAQSHSAGDLSGQALPSSPETSSLPTQITAPEKTTPATPDPATPDPATSEEPIKVPSPNELTARKLISHDSGDNLEVLNEALERWLTKKDALPERVGDLVNEQFLPMLPMAPEGKIFAIDAENRRVILIAEEKK